MEWQLIPVTLIIVGAIFYLCREGWRSWCGQKVGCGGQCRCAAPAGGVNQNPITWISTDQLRLRRDSRNQPR